MIEYNLPSRRKPPAKWSYTPQVHVPPKRESTGNLTIIDEVKRRDAIVQELFRTCPYNVGDIVKPHSKEEEAKYGSNILVEFICNSYTQLGKNEKWPKSDSPMIVTAFSQDKGERFYCTTGYLVKK